MESPIGGEVKPVQGLKLFMKMSKVCLKIAREGEKWDGV